MKKLSYLLLLAVVMVMSSCSDDDENLVVVNFDSLLKSGQTEFTSTSTEVSGYYYADTFKDEKGIATYTHRYADWGYGYTFSSITYTNSTDNTSATSPAPISGKAHSGDTYLAINSGEGTYSNPGTITINDPDKYAFRGVWVSNSTYAYNGMTVGDSYATKFTKGSWYKVIAIGLDAAGNEIGRLEIYTANYASDSDLPSRDWQYFDLTALQNAVTINFVPDTSDKGTYGANTALYFCLDDLTFVEK
jgi:hypothetical protein